MSLLPSYSRVDGLATPNYGAGTMPCTRSALGAATSATRLPVEGSRKPQAMSYEPARRPELSVKYRTCRLTPGGTTATTSWLGSEMESSAQLNWLEAFTDAPSSTRAVAPVWLSIT